jgi:hypothetical protein
MELKRKNSSSQNVLKSLFNTSKNAVKSVHQSLRGDEKEADESSPSMERKRSFLIDFAIDATDDAAVSPSVPLPFNSPF